MHGLLTLRGRHQECDEQDGHHRVLHRHLHLHLGRLFTTLLDSLTYCAAGLDL